MLTSGRNRTGTRRAVGLAILAAMFAGGPSLAAGERLEGGVGAVLYEVAEDAYFLDANGAPVSDPTQAVVRVGTAPLSGWVELGTPLCPSRFLLTYPRAKRCAINGIGTSVVDLQSGPTAGTGPVSGSFGVVVQADNPADAPEGVVISGKFSGRIDLSPAFGGTPIGFLTEGVFEVDPGPFSPGGSFGFTGTFRLPFSIAANGARARARNGGPAFYLTENGRLDRVRQEERSIGWATVRLEIRFQ